MGLVILEFDCDSIGYIGFDCNEVGYDWLYFDYVLFIFQAFSIDDATMTLGINNPWYFQYIGRRYSNILSYGDVKVVNKLYKCMSE